MEVLRVLLRLYQLPYYKSMQQMHVGRVMRCAAYFGRLEMLKWLLQELSRDPEWTWELGVLVRALQNPLADVELLKWLCENSPPESQLLHESVGDGYSCAKWTPLGRQISSRESGEGCTTDAVGEAAQHGHLAVLKFLHENRYESCTLSAMDHACGEGDHLDVVQFLHGHRSEGCTEEALKLAVSHNNLATISFPHADRPEVSVREFVATTYVSNDELLKFVYLNLPGAIPDTSLTGCFEEDETLPDPNTFGAICAHSTKGCLFEAREQAQKYKYVQVVQLFDAYISDNIESCSLAQHSPEGPRRCQETQVTGMLVS